MNGNEIDPCRTCLCTETSRSLLDFCQEESLHLYEMVMTFCSVTIKTNDGLPKSICLQCFERIKIAFSFKKKCEQVEKYLRGEASDLLNLNQAKNEHYIYLTKSEINIKQESDLEPECLIGNDYADSIVDNEDNDFRVKEESEHPEPIIPLASLLSGKEDLKLYKKLKKIKKSPLSLSKRLKESYITNCPHCDFKTSKSSVIKRHLMIHDDVKPLSCDLCSFRCVQSSSLKVHRATHTTEKPFACNRCDYKSNNSSNLKRHLRRHTKDKPYSCDICTYRCSQSSGLKEHKKIHTNEKPYLCDQCHYVCRSANMLKNHNRNKHTGEKQYSCDQCGFRCKTKSTLICHIKRHMGIRNFSCEFCPYKSIQLASLENHRKMVHTGERPFACDQCPYRCINATYLKIHQKTHLKIKRYSCDLCPYMCDSMFKMKNHKMTHTGEKPYLCNICNFRSAQSSSLKRHKRRHHYSVGVK